VKLIPFHELRRQVKPYVGPASLECHAFGLGPVKFDAPLAPGRGRELKPERQRDSHPRNHAAGRARNRPDFQGNRGLIPVASRTMGRAQIGKLDRTDLDLLGAR